MSNNVKLRAIIIIDYEADPENYIGEDQKKPTPEQMAELDAGHDPLEFLQIMVDEEISFTVIPA